MRLFDTHAHYNDGRFEEYEGGASALLSHLHEKEGVDFVLNAATSIKSCTEVLALAEKFDFCYCALGIHPEDCGKEQSPEEAVAALRELLKHEKITDYTTVWMDSLRGGETQLVNTNKLVRFYNGTTGLKTGTTSKAGHCLSASAKRDGLHLIAVVMGAENSTDRFEGAKAMLNWGFASFETVTPEIDSALLSPVRVLKGADAYVDPVIEELTPLTLEAGQKDKIETVIALPENIEAPCEENQILGKVTLTVDGTTVGEFNLRCKNPVEKITFGVMLLRFLKVLSKSL